MPVDYFNLYVKMGLCPIALYHRQKKPIGINWNEDWNYDRSRRIFADNPLANMGILLGDVVDVEGDTREANELLKELIGDVPHPHYASSKSHHHLFKTPDPKLTRLVVNGVEFRGHRHQSVVPPSIVSIPGMEDVKYRWFKESNYNIPDMPQRLVDYYWENVRVEEPKVEKKKKKGVPPGLTRCLCGKCGRIEFIHKSRLALEVIAFRNEGLGWSCHKCRTLDVREACRQIRDSQKPHSSPKERYELLRLV